MRNLASELRQAVSGCFQWRIWSRRTPQRPRDAGPSGRGVRELRRRGDDVLDAAGDGLEGAVRHFLGEDPRCAKEADDVGGEAWWVAREVFVAGFSADPGLLNGVCWAFSGHFDSRTELVSVSSNDLRRHGAARGGAPRHHRPALGSALRPRLRGGAAAAAEGGHRGEAE